jgi:hypothetical protein
MSKEIIIDVTKRGRNVKLTKDIGMLIYSINNNVIDKAPYSLKNLVRFTNTAKNTINFLSR